MEKKDSEMWSAETRPSKPCPAEVQPKEARPKLWTAEFVALAAINFATFFGFNSMTTGMPVYVSTLGGSDFIVGLTTTLTSGAALVVRPFVGFMLDRFGRKGILVASLVATFFIIAAYAVFPIIGLILALRVVHGIAWGLSSTSVSTIAADVIPRSRFAEGMGYFGLMSSLAVAIAPALAIALLDSVGAGAMIAVACAATLIALVLAVLQRSTMPAPPAPAAPGSAPAAPGSAPAAKPGAPTAKSGTSAADADPESKFSDKKPSGESPSDGGLSGDKPQARGFTLSSLFERKSVLPAVIMFLVNLAFGAITTFVAICGQSRGVQNISLYFVVYAVSSMVTRPLIGRVIDTKGYLVPGALSCVGMSLTLVIIAFSQNILMFCLAGVCAGFGCGTAMGTFQAMAVAAAAPNRRGVATSTYFFGFDAGIAVGALVSGAIANAFGYAAMYCVMAAAPLVACAVLLLARKSAVVLAR